MLGKALDVVTETPPGQLISGGEEQVRDLFADLKRRSNRSFSLTAAQACETLGKLERVRQVKQVQASDHFKRFRIVPNGTDGRTGMDDFQSCQHRLLFNPEPVVRP